ncbi:MAG: efflux RND transporter periplasmic adaptor subunit [Bacteroidota bacterium]|nr:efflux RND transporter periplasmic adaptor subunit [Bacteroidota bacterium]
MAKNKKIIISVSGVVVLALCLAFFLKGTPTNNFQLETTKLAANNISSTVTATGTIQPIIEVAVGTQVSGKVSKIYVDYNSVVKKGELLAEIDKTNLQTEVNTQELAVRTTKVEYEYQKKNYARAKELFGKSLISETDYETANYNYEKAESSYKQSLSNLNKAKTDLSYATIYSPIDGVVLSRAVEEGQTVAASFSTPTLFTIAKDLTKMQVVANVDEADIGTVKVQQRVTFTVDAYPTDIFDGTITQVRLNPTTTSNVVTYQVIVNAPNPDLKLKPGLTANISIYTMEKADIKTLPNKALNLKPDIESLKRNGYTVYENLEIKNKLTSNERIIWQQEGRTIRNKRITIGDSDANNTEIISGVGNKDRIITEIKSILPVEPAAGTEASPFMPKRPGGNKDNGNK